MKKYLVIALILIFVSGIQSVVFAKDNENGILLAAATTKKNKKLDAQVETRRIPKGTRLKVKLLDPVSTNGSQVGEMFNSMLITDEKIDNAMILPSGTLLRGYVQEIKPAKLASIGAVLYINFDHIVTPTGTQLQIKSALTNNAKVTVDGGIREQSGYGDALKENWSTTKKIVSKSTNWGLNKQNVVAKCVLTPIGAVGGTIGGGAYLVGDSVIDIFRKGKQVVLNQDDVVEIVITQDLDVPVI